MPNTFKVVLNISITLEVYAAGIASIAFLLLSLNANLIKSFLPRIDVLYNE